ncbi:hypothetical protein CDAR_518011 [Caerostris darwini]|uniref:Uncharacterized protein n=1 Tax=Caerostris darwini TaxID=1538125 RepID=A0AAV4QRK5_9ARAC|nr:hypothetical protein CDAR_518011 [Caerostris darwini]
MTFASLFLIPSLLSALSHKSSQKFHDKTVAPSDKSSQKFHDRSGGADYNLRVSFPNHYPPNTLFQPDTQEESGTRTKKGTHLLLRFRQHQDKTSTSSDHLPHSLILGSRPREDGSRR